MTVAHIIVALRINACPTNNADLHARCLVLTSASMQGYGFVSRKAALRKSFNCLHCLRLFMIRAAWRLFRLFSVLHAIAHVSPSTGRYLMKLLCVSCQRVSHCVRNLQDGFACCRIVRTACCTPPSFFLVCWLNVCCHETSVVHVVVSLNSSRCRLCCLALRPALVAFS